MINCRFYRLGESKPETVEQGRIADYLTKLDGVLWVELADRSPESIDLLKTVFKFHPLAIEDVEHGEQRPKVAEFDDYIFFVVYELLSNSESGPDGTCVKRGAELHLFVGRSFFVSIHDGSSKRIEEVRHRWEMAGEQQALGPYYLHYLLLDSVVDSYFGAVDLFDDRIEEIEDRITTPNERKGVLYQGDRGALSELVVLRHNLIMMRRVVTPLRDAVNVLLRRVEGIEDRPLPDDIGPRIKERARLLFAYYQDVYDHTIRVVDSVDTYRDILSGLVDANLAVVSNRLNDIMKVLTSVSIILMSVATITGWYGMNFEHIPELHFKHGYEYVISLSLAVAVAEWIYFRHRRWL